MLGDTWLLLSPREICSIKAPEEKWSQTYQSKAEDLLIIKKQYLIKKSTTDVCASSRDPQEYLKII